MGIGKYHRTSNPKPITINRRKGHLVNPHPRREYRQSRQSGPNRPIGNNEHPRFARGFKQLGFLHLDGDQDDTAEEHGQADEQAIAGALLDEGD